MMELQLMSRNEFLFKPYQNKTKQNKNFLSLAAHLHKVPGSRSGLYHFHQGFWGAETVRTTRGPQNAYESRSLILRSKTKTRTKKQKQKSKANSPKHIKIPLTKRYQKD